MFAIATAIAIATAMATAVAIVTRRRRRFDAKSIDSSVSGGDKSIESSGSLEADIDSSVSF